MNTVIRTDGLLTVEPADVACLTDVGLTYREETCLTEDALISTCGDAAGLLVLREPITARVLDELPECKVVTRFGVGVDTVDVLAASARGVRVTNVPDANSSEVASHALAMIMSLVRRLPHFSAAIRSGTWSYLETGRGMRRVDQLVLGVVGFGRTGRRVAAAAAAIGFQVRAYDPLVPGETIRVAGAMPVGLEEIIADSDIVSLHLPLTAETRNLIDRDAITRMREGAILVNVSRGGLVDEAALAEALTAGHLSGAGLDAFESEPIRHDSPLLAIPSLLLSPHAGHYSNESYRETIRKAFLDVARVLRGEEPVYPVN